MLDSQTISIAINQPWHDVYEAIWRPEDFPKWASGLSNSSLQQDGEQWSATGPAGPVTIRFTPHNFYGVMDHWVETQAGQVIYVPLRVIQNGQGSEVQLTLFRQPEKSAREFESDAEWVLRDLTALRLLLNRN